jgi:hypothetical protein
MSPPTSNSPALPTDQSTTSGGAMSVAEFCQWASVGTTTAYAEAKTGRLEMRKIGSKTVIIRSDAEQWLRSLPTARRLRPQP